MDPKYVFGLVVGMIFMLIFLPSTPATSSELSYAETLCKDNGGVSVFRPGKQFIYRTSVDCGNGAEFKFTRKEAIDGIFERQLKAVKDSTEKLP